MSQALQVVLTVLFTVEWDARTLLILSDDRVVYERPANAWLATYCTGDRTDRTESDRCDDYSCNECFAPWSPRMPQQGSLIDWYEGQLALARESVARVQSEMDREWIRIDHVQQVAHDYAVHGEWCSVYEQAMDSLSRLSGKDVSPLSVEDDVIMTIRVRMHVAASRRQRAGDTDFMRQSVHWSNIERALMNVSLFDSDYEESEVSLSEVDIDLA